VIPANQASWEDIQTVFGTRGVASTCQCQRYKLLPRESFGSFPAEERADRLMQQTGCGNPASASTSGLLAYIGAQPVGWCAVEPRTAYFGMARTGRVPWVDRNEDKSDPTVWAVTCLLTRAGFRRQGVSRTLVHASVPFARTNGTRALEAYPMVRASGLAEELHVGLTNVFADAGFREVARPTIRRAVMRTDF
jgi:GNAT superfamily N-acetyltransferase